MSFQRVKATTPELTRLKKKKNFSEKGEHLLDLKRQQILSNLKQSLDQYLKEKFAMRDDMELILKLLEKSYENIGKGRLKTIATLNEKILSPNVDIKFINEMGIDVPKITLNFDTDKLPPYSFSDTVIHLDKLTKVMKTVLQKITSIAEIDSKIYHLSDNHKKIQRRINALEDIIVPKLTKDINSIEEILDDNEREEFIRMKKTKEMLEEKNNQGNKNHAQKQEA